MFTVEVLESIGKQPIVLNASQVVVRLSNGTPVSVAALYGGDDSVLVSHCDDKNFNENLDKIGISSTVIVEKVAVK